MVQQLIRRFAEKVHSYSLRSSAAGHKLFSSTLGRSNSLCGEACEEAALPTQNPGEAANSKALWESSSGPSAMASLLSSTVTWVLSAYGTYSVCSSAERGWFCSLVPFCLMALRPSQTWRKRRRFILKSADVFHFAFAAEWSNRLTVSSSKRCHGGEKTGRAAQAA